MTLIIVWWIGTLVAIGILSGGEKSNSDLKTQLILFFYPLCLWPLVIGIALGKIAEGSGK